MIYLVLSILTTTCLFVLFKLFDRFKLNTLLAVVVNYATAATIGFMLNSYHPKTSITDQRWFLLAVFLGFVFISIFNLLGFTAQRIGLSVSSVANKMSLVIPFTIAVILYDQRINALRILGILLSLLAVYFTSSRKKEDQPSDVHEVSAILKFLLPFLLFIGSGILDSLLNFSQLMYLNEDNSHLFNSVAFGSAATIGCIVLLIKRPRVERMGYSVLGGLVLGTINYISIYCFLKALEIPTLQSSVIIPVNNIGVVAVSALCALLAFKEKFSAKNVVGLVLSGVAITLLYLN